MFDQIRRRLTVGYVGILALILLVFGVVVVFTFYLRASDQQDDLLLQKAEDKANSVLSGKDRYSVVKATTDYDVAVIVLLPDGSTYGDLDETSFSLGLPHAYMAQRAGQERRTIRGTVPGPGGAVRVMSIPVKRYGEFGSVVAVVQAAQSRRGGDGDGGTADLRAGPHGLGSAGTGGGRRAFHVAAGDASGPGSVRQAEDVYS